MGWNSVDFRVDHPLLQGIPNGSHFYFVHSYYADPADESVVAGYTRYGVDFCSAAAWHNVFAIQFHPEKSGDVGLRLYRNFVEHVKSDKRDMAWKSSPAIDLRGGRCVRLYQGDYARETVYSDAPAEVAARWIEAGASRLHVVDLDGAKAGAPVNLPAIESIAAAATVPVQLGGGIRSVESARAALALGVDRVMTGTAAVRDPESVAAMCDALGPEAVVVSVDARDGIVALDGWTRSSRVRAAELMHRMAEMGVVRFLYTDIARDGTLSGPNYGAIEDLRGEIDAGLIAAGGISSVEHLLRLRDIGVEAAVVGKALYTGDVSLPEAIRSLRSKNPLSPGGRGLG